MNPKLPTLHIQTFGTFEFRVVAEGKSTSVFFTEFDAVLLSIVRSAPTSSIPLLRLKSVLFPTSDQENFSEEIQECLKRIGQTLADCDPRLAAWLKISKSELSLDAAISCDADFMQVSQQREAIDLLPLGLVISQLEINKGEFLAEFSVTPWIEKRRLRFTRAFHTLLARQMELYAADGVSAKAETVAHKLLQDSPFNLSALQVLARIEARAAPDPSIATDFPEKRWHAVEIKLFGPGKISIPTDATSHALVISGYARKLLAVLVCSPNRMSSKDVLFDTLWPRATKAQARQRLHVALHELRASLDSIQEGYSSLIASDRVAVSIHDEMSVSIDIDLLRGSAQTLNTLKIEEIDQILATTSGEFLQGERELSWITQMRRNCDQQVVKVMVQKAEQLFAAQKIGAAKAIAEQAFEKHSASEDACAILMRCHQALGTREQAIDAFDRLRRVLRDEFDMKASEKLATLANSIRQNEPVHAPVVSLVPLVEMRAVLEDSKSKPLHVSVMPTQNATKAGPWGQDPIDPTADGAYGGLRRMFLDQLVQTVWVWGPPGLGKKTLIKTVADEFRSSKLCKIHWLDTDKILQDPAMGNALIGGLLVASNEAPVVARNIVIATWPTTPATIKALADAIHQSDSKALCVFVCQKFPKVKSCVKLRAPGFEAWSQRSGSIEVSPAVNAFCKFAQARGFADLVDRSTVSYLDSLCKYCGGVPGILEELAERLDISPLNLLQGWLSMQAQVMVGLGSEDESFTARYSAYVRDSAQVEFSVQARLVLKALCAVRSPVSLYTLADIIGASRFEAIVAVEGLVEVGLVTTFRSREFDLVFVCISGFVADVLNQEYAFQTDDKLMLAMVTHYGKMNFPRAETARKLNYRFDAEVLRFEYVWIEMALDYALKAELQQDVIALSRLLRRFYFDAGHVDAASRFFNRALSSSTDTLDLADFNTVLGGLYGRAGFGRLANKHLLKAIRLARQINDEIREATATHSLGLSVGASGRFERGVKFMQSASALYLKNGLLDRESVIIYSLGFLYLNELQLDFPRNMLEVKRPVHLANKTQSVATWHIVKAYLAYFEENLPLAWHHVTTGMKIAEEINLVQICFKAQLTQGMLLISEDKPVDAVVTLKRSMQQMVFHDYRSDAAHAMALLALAHLMAGNVNDALEAQSKAEQLIENVDDMQSTSMLAYSRMTYIVALNRAIDDTWFRSEIVAKWKLFPAYVQRGFLAYKSVMIAKLGHIEFSRVFTPVQLENRPMPAVFEAVSRSLEQYTRNESTDPWFTVTVI
jgi:DNA-binding SARP family transcriptional activator/tetratricopeptide (TPR) repeat protein